MTPEEYEYQDSLPHVRAGVVGWRPIIELIWDKYLDHMGLDAARWPGRPRDERDFDTYFSDAWYDRS